MRIRSGEILFDDHSLKDWGHVRWMVDLLLQNATFVFGPEGAVQATSEVKKSATILTLVEKEKSLD